MPGELPNPVLPVLPVLPVATRRSRVFEFLVVGGVTPFLYPVAWLLRRVFGADDTEYVVSFFFFYLAHFINDPHFAVTYLLFYRDVKRRALGGVWGPAQRARYLFAGFIAPLLMLGWGFFAVWNRSAPGLGALVQIMFLLVGWHYGKQGFGVLTVLSQRRGVAFDAFERRVFLAHTFSAWAYAWSSPADPGTEMEERGVVYQSMPHGPMLAQATLVVLAVTVVLVAFVLGRRIAGKRPLPPWSALIGFFCSLWPWTIYSRLDPLVLYAIPALHSIQYLYFVGLLRGGGAGGDERPFTQRSAVKRLAVLALVSIGLAWILFHGVPETLDAIFFPGRVGLEAADYGNLGPTPIFAALFVSINLHHYFMDFVIWRRENPEMAELRVKRPAPVILSEVAAE